MSLSIFALSFFGTQSETVKRRAFNKDVGPGKNPKLINVGPTSIPDYRVGTCFRFYTQMRVEKTNKAFAYRIYSHFTQQCGLARRVWIFSTWKAEIISGSHYSQNDQWLTSENHQSKPIFGIDYYNLSVATVKNGMELFSTYLVFLFLSSKYKMFRNKFILNLRKKSS